VVVDVASIVMSMVMSPWLHTPMCQQRLWHIGQTMLLSLQAVVVVAASIVTQTVTFQWPLEYAELQGLTCQVVVRGQSHHNKQRFLKPTMVTCITIEGYVRR
jgi:hypothetical protein